MIKITKDDIMKIKDIGRTLFAEAQSFDGLSAADTQALLLVKATEIFLQGKGVEPGFKVEVNTSRHKKDYEGSIE